MPSRRVVVREARIETDLEELFSPFKEGPPGQTRHLILGIDGGQIEGRMQGMGEWLGHFWGIQRHFDPHEFASTVFLLIDQEGDPARLDDRDLDRLVEAGACLREKTAAYADVDLATALRADLVSAGLISAEEVEEFEEAPEQLASRGADPDSGALIGYYADPPFAWPADAIRQLLGDRGHDTTIRLPR